MTKNINRILIILFFNFIMLGNNIWAYVLIKDLDPRDSNYTLLKTNQKKSIQVPTEISFFEYQLKKDDTLLSISKSTDTSISSLISLNRINRSDQINEGDYILIPSQKGLFSTINPNSDLEYLMYNRIYPNLKKEIPIVIRAQYARISDAFYYLENLVLTKIEYQLWLSKSFSMPILKGTVSSYFGNRISPISGKPIFHAGIDIAADSGSPIFTSLSGKVIKDGYSGLYGYYIIIEHDNNFKTLYGHLLDAKIKIGDLVKAGQQIGYLGNTGTSTGAHIHFEIHYNNKAVNPLQYLNKE